MDATAYATIDRIHRNVFPSHPKFLLHMRHNYHPEIDHFCFKRKQHTTCTHNCLRLVYRPEKLNFEMAEEQLDQYLYSTPAMHIGKTKVDAYAIKEYDLTCYIEYLVEILVHINFSPTTIPESLPALSLALLLRFAQWQVFIQTHFDQLRHFTRHQCAMSDSLYERHMALNRYEIRAVYLAKKYEPTVNLLLALACYRHRNLKEFPYTQWRAYQENEPVNWYRSGMLLADIVSEYYESQLSHVKHT